MNIRLKDVAKQAGVSITTASRVLKSDSNISASKETKEKIWKAAKELGYQNTNQAKQKMSSMNIGFILQMTKERFEDTFFSEIIYGIEQEIIQQKLNLAFAYIVFDLDDPAVKRSVLTSGVDGLIFIGVIPENHFSALVNAFPNCVSTLSVPSNNSIDCITIDYEDTVHLLIRQMIEYGHKDIAFIGGSGYAISPEESQDGVFFKHEKRFQGYLKALVDCGITIKPEIIKDGNWEMEIAYYKMLEILDSGVKITAVFAAGDRMAFGAMRAIQERGLRIPEDISIAGFDDVEMAQYISPPLTTIGYPKEEIGRLAVKLLIENMHTNKTYHKKIVLPTYIVERSSIKRIN
jgi:DNA-binding LacI/PurR family transcriptional regulator